MHRLGRHPRGEGDGAGGGGVIHTGGRGAVGGRVSDAHRGGRGLVQGRGEHEVGVLAIALRHREIGDGHLGRRRSDSHAVELQTGDRRAGSTGVGLESERRALARADLAVPGGVGHHIGGADMAGDDAVPDIDDFCRSVEADRPAVEGLARCHVHRAVESRTPVVGDGVGHRPAASGRRRCHRDRCVGDGAGCRGRGEGGAGGVGQGDGEGLGWFGDGVTQNGHADLLSGDPGCE